MNRVFAYTVNSRVVWLSDKVFHLPVLDDLYRLHSVENCQDIKPDDCVNYTVKYFHKFIQDELVSSPLREEAKNDILIIREKIKCFTRLSDFIQCSFLSSMPIVFTEENDKLEILSKSIIDCTDLNGSQMAKHQDFINSMIREKKDELKRRYLHTVNLLKKAQSLEEVKEVEYTLIYEGIHVI